MLLASLHYYVIYAPFFCVTPCGWFVYIYQHIFCVSFLFTPFFIYAHFFRNATKGVKFRGLHVYIT